MKNTFLFFTVCLCFFYNTLWSQTSYGGLIEPGTTAGTGVNDSNSYFGHEAGAADSGLKFSNTFIGGSSGYNNDGNWNTFVGQDSGYNNGTGSLNTFVGQDSGHNNVSGSGNTFLGRYSGFDNNTGDYNTFVGLASGSNNQTGSGNVFLGHGAGSDEMGSDLLYIDNSDTSSPLIWGDFASNILNFNGNIGVGLNPDGGDPPTQALDVQGTARLRDIPENNILTRVLVSDTDGNIGWRADATIGDSHSAPSYPESAGDGGGNTNSFFGHLTGSINTGADNTLVGFQSGLNNTTGYENSSLGSRTLENNTIGVRNTANGVFTLFGNTQGNENSAVGYAALGFNITGNGNTATGFRTLLNNGGGNHNTANGYEALLNNTSSGNTAMGHNALIGNTGGANNVAIGRDASIFNQTGSENVIIGYNSGAAFGQIDLNNTIAIGSNVSIMASNQVILGNFEVEEIAGAAVWTVVSDERFKINIEEDVAGLDFIKSLRPVSYNLDRRKIRAFTGNTNATNSDVSKKTVGFIAQEVEQAVQENDYVFTGVKTPANEKDHYGLKYAEFVVPLVKGMQEQQELIEELRQEIETLKSLVYGNNISLPTSATGLKAEATLSKGFALAQNIPNPFDKITIITAELPETVNQAKIVIYNLNGIELQSYPLQERGRTSVEVKAGALQSGMYLYALLADGQLIDTKKMILTR